MALERRFGVTIDEGAYAECRTVEDLKKLVSEPALTGGSRSATADRCGRFSGLEPVEMGVCDPPDESSAVDPATGEGFYVGARRRPGASTGPGASGHICPEPSESLDIPALMQALPVKWAYRHRSRDVKRVLRCALSSRTAHPWRAIHKQPELLLVDSRFQCLPVPAAGGRSPADATLRRRTRE